MAVALRTTDFPEGIGTDMYDGVQAEMDIANDPPEGLIFHWAGEVDGKWTITDVWESRDAYERFREQRLSPAIQKVSGIDPASGPQPKQAAANPRLESASPRRRISRRSGTLATSIAPITRAAPLPLSMV